MTDKQALLTLADQCEAAPPEQQRALLEEAFWRTFPADVEMVMHGPFHTMLDCEAFVDAALSMMPEGWKPMIDDTAPPCCVDLWRQADGGEVPGCITGHGNTIALALLAASTKAKAQDVDNDNQS